MIITEVKNLPLFYANLDEGDELEETLDGGDAGADLGEVVEEEDGLDEGKTEF